MATTDDHEGQPGEPGEPGESGHDGGGAGGAGGMGGRGGRGAEEKRWLVLVIIGVIVTVALSVTTLVLLERVNSNSDHVAAIEHGDNERARALIVALEKANDRQDATDEQARRAEYRICLRQQVTRAALINHTIADKSPIVLPLYSCRPNLDGGQATILSPKQRAAFLARVAQGKNLP